MKTRQLFNSAQGPSDYDPSHDWLDALQVFVHAGHKSMVQGLYRDVHFGPIGDVLPVATFKPFQGSIVVTLDKGIVDLPRIERIEIMCYIAAHSWKMLIKASDEEELILCHELGCCHSPTSTVHERWRLIVGELDPREKEGYRSRSLVSQLFEDRKACGWCNSPMATGTASLVRPTVHQSCLDYLNKIIIPQQRAALAAERKAYAANQ